MIIIKNIDFIEVDKTRYELLSKPHSEPVWVKDNEGPRLADFTEFEEELIIGRRYKRPSDGTDVYIGVSREAQNIIGLQYEAWDNLQREHDFYYGEHSRLLKIIEEINQASFWTRVKSLFSYAINLYPPRQPDTPSGM